MYKYWMKYGLLVAAVFFAAELLGQPVAKQTFLHDEWLFALDPVKVGETQHWFGPDFNTSRWDKVVVPHCYTVDKRYHYYTGTAWYRKQFQKIVVPQGYRAFIRFEAVFYKAQVWLNGKKLGTHEGGYTPFEFEMTSALANENVLSLQVDNAWDTTTIPGAKTQVSAENSNVGQLFPWINYGGIIREVKIIVRPVTYVENLRVVATPDLDKKTADIQVMAYVNNTSEQSFRHASMRVNLYHEGTKIPVKFTVDGHDVVPAAKGVFVFRTRLSSKDVRLWDQDNPVLYKAECIAGIDTVAATFGIRKVEVSGTQLLLNGEPIRMGGCNRPLDFPGHGSTDPNDVLQTDLTLIKNGSMELSRISHYPVSTQLMDWADRNGILLISEAGNWQMTPQQMDDPVMRKKFQLQVTEMVERDWNHPSVVAWSVGNEYQSQTEAGKAWTRDMYAFVKALDPSRLVTFASMFVFRDIIKRPEDEASQHVDFISANIYGDHLKNLRHIHQLYPNKPIYISEFGLRADGVKHERERVEHLRKAMEDFRQCNFLIGASIWTFNDYQSSFPGTNPNGYRPWGLVSPEREPREMYWAWQEEFSPATIDVKQEGTKIVVTVTARNDFPRYTMRNYKLKVGESVYDIALLNPGESKRFECDLPLGKLPANATVELLKPRGFVVLKRRIDTSL